MTTDTAVLLSVRQARPGRPTPGFVSFVQSFGYVSLSVDSKNVARVPIAAVFDQGQGPSVWVVDPVGATLRVVRVALAGYDADSAFIGAGVPEGAKVVALGVHKLAEGEKVRVVENLAGL